jgi:hypothetical protein
MTHQGYPPEATGHGTVPSTPEVATRAVAEPGIEEVVDADAGAPETIMATGRLLWRRLANAVGRTASEYAAGDAGTELRCMRCGRTGRLLRAEDPDEGEEEAALDSS